MFGKKNKNLTPGQLLAKNATSSKKQFAHEPTTQTLKELADHCKTQDNASNVFKYLIQRINDKDSLQHVEKTLLVIEYLILHAHINFPKLCSGQTKLFSKYSTYFYKVDGTDIGQNVRRRARNIVLLVTNGPELADKRALAQGKKIPPKKKAPRRLDSDLQQEIEGAKGKNRKKSKSKSKKSKDKSSKNKNKSNKSQNSNKNNNKNKNSANNDSNDAFGNAFDSDPFSDMPAESNEIEGQPNNAPKMNVSDNNNNKNNNNNNNNSNNNDLLFGGSSNNNNNNNVNNSANNTNNNNGNNDAFGGAFASDDPFLSMEPAFGTSSANAGVQAAFGDSVNFDNSNFNNNNTQAGRQNATLSVASAVSVANIGNNDEFGFGQASVSNIFVVSNDQNGGNGGTGGAGGGGGSGGNDPFSSGLTDDPFASMTATDINNAMNTDNHLNKINNNNNNNSSSNNNSNNDSNGNAMGGNISNNINDLFGSSNTGNGYSNSNNNNNNNNSSMNNNNSAGVNTDDIFAALSTNNNNNSNINSNNAGATAASTDNPFAMFGSNNDATNNNSSNHNASDPFGTADDTSNPFM